MVKIESYKSPPTSLRTIHQCPKSVSICDYGFEKCWEIIIYQPILINGYIAFSYKLQNFFFQLQEGTYHEAAAIIKFSFEFLNFCCSHFSTQLLDNIWIINLLAAYLNHTQCVEICPSSLM